MITPEIIKKIRFENKLSQNDLGQKIGVSHYYISMLENGKKPITSKFETKLKEIGLLLPEKEETDLDLEQVTKLYIKFRAGDRQAGDLLEEKICLMKKILDTQE